MEQNGHLHVVFQCKHYQDLENSVNPMDKGDSKHTAGFLTRVTDKKMLTLLSETRRET